MSPGRAGGSTPDSGHSALSPRDVPEARQDLIDWVLGPGGQLFAERGRASLGPALVSTLRQADLYFVSADMTHLARTIGQGLRVYALSGDDLPSQHGLLVWDGPATGEGPGPAPCAVSWMSSGAKVMLSLLVPAQAYRSWCAQYSTDAARDAATVTAGRLVYRGHGPALPLDGLDLPWERANFGDHEETTRTFLATLLLISQPVDARRPLHEVEDVSPSRASQKRIQRAGGDPTQAVRYVTLRQSIRPSDESDPDGGGHARRIYRHRWFVKPHRRTYPDQSDPTGRSRRWVGPYMVVPAGCEDAPILGGERVNVLRR